MEDGFLIQLLNNFKNGTNKYFTLHLTLCHLSQMDNIFGFYDNFFLETTHKFYI